MKTNFQFSFFTFCLVFLFCRYSQVQAQCITKPLTKPAVTQCSAKDTFVRISTPNLVFIADIVQIKDAGQIELTVNETQANFTYSKCKLISKLHLRIGLSTLKLKMRNEAGIYEQSWYINCGIPDSTLLPELEFNSPGPEKDTVTDRLVRLQATAYNIFKANQIKITLNGQNYPAFEFKLNRSQLIADLYFQRGENNLEITLMNKAGNLTYHRKMFLIETDKKPVIEITSPDKQFGLTFNPVMTVDAIVRNIRHSDQIQVWINGKETRTFSFDYKDERVKVQIPLQRGSNGIKIQVKNTMGSSEASRKFYFDPTLAPTREPEYGRLEPAYVQATEPNLKETDEYMSLPVWGIDNIKEVELFLNGAPLIGATYDRVYRKIYFDANLRIGINYLKVVGKNALGKSEYIFSIQFYPYNPGK